MIQKDMKNLYEDTLRLGSGSVEKKRGANPKRFRMNASLLDANTRTADPDYLDLTCYLYYGRQLLWRGEAILQY